MDNTPLRKTLVLAASVGLLIAAFSGGAVTYAAFTDSGNVDVTFTAGNFSDTSGDVSTTESMTEENDTSLNDSDGTDNETSLNDSDTTNNETSLNDSDGTDNETSLNDSDSTDNETSLNDSDSTDNETSLNDSNTTDNETRLTDPARLSGGSPLSDILTANGLDVARTGDVIPAAAVTAVYHRRLPAAPPPLGG